VAYDALIDQVFTETLDDFHLLFRRQTSDGQLDDSADRSLIDRDEATEISARSTEMLICHNAPLVVHESEETHDELTVHAIRHAAVTRNGVPKVFDVECPLETRGEEPSERGDEGGKSRQN